MTGPDPAQSKPTRSTSKPKTSRGTRSSTAPEEAIAETDEVAAQAEAVAPTAAAAAVVSETVTAAQAVAAPEATAPAAAVASTAAPAVAPAAAEPVVPAVVSVAAPAAVVAEAVTAAEPVVPAAPSVAAPTADQPAIQEATAQAAAGPSRLSTPDVAGAVDKAMDRLRTHLTMGEIVAGLGAVIILGIAFGLFGVFFGHGGTWPNDLVVLLSIGLLGALVLQNAHIHDFGPGYRLLIATFCLALGVIAALQILRELRFLINGSTFDIGGLTWWAGAVVAVIGGIMVWHEER